MGMRDREDAHIRAQVAVLADPDISNGGVENDTVPVDESRGSHVDTKTIVEGQRGLDEGGHGTGAGVSECGFSGGQRRSSLWEINLARGAEPVHVSIVKQ